MDKGDVGLEVDAEDVVGEGPLYEGFLAFESAVEVVGVEEGNVTEK